MGRPLFGRVGSDDSWAFEDDSPLSYIPKASEAAVDRTLDRIRLRLLPPRPKTAGDFVLHAPTQSEAFRLPA